MKRNYVNNSMDEMYAKVALVERNDRPFGHDLVNAQYVGKKVANDLVELAMEIQKADSNVQANACSKLQAIAQQVRFLQLQAQDVLSQAKKNMYLHHVACNFVKVPGNTYHLYKRPSGQEYFSMLSPEEWSNRTHEYMGSFRLEIDSSWTPIEQLHKKDNELKLIYQILDTTAQNFLPQALSSSVMET